MNYDNFEKTVSSSITQKGMTYFESGAVTELEKENGTWCALVLGTEEYNVEIGGIRKIKDWYCDCPYDHGDVCKHVVAVLYAIRDKKAKSARSPKKKSPKKEVDQIFSKVPPEELLQFFRKNLRSFKDLKQRLLAEFMDYVEVGDDQNKYVVLIQKMINSAGNNRYGYIDYKEGRKLANNIYTLINKADQYVDEKNFVEALGIAKSLILELSKMLNETNDSSGELQGCLEGGYDIIPTLLDAPIAPTFKDAIFKDLYEILTSHNATVAEVDYNILSIMEQYSWEEDQVNKIITYLKNIIPGLTGENDEYNKESCIRYQISFLEKKGAVKEIALLESEHIDLVRIRMPVVERYIEAEKYDKAIQLVNQGIEVANTKRHRSIVGRWKEVLIRITELNKDIETQRRLLKERYFDNFYRDKDSYVAYKNTFTKKEWLDERAALISFFKNEKPIKKRWGVVYRYRPLLPQLYIHEKMWEDLKDFITSEQLPLSEKIELASYLEEKYPKDVLDIYQLYALELIGRSNSRKKYSDVVVFLQRMIKVNNSQSMVDGIVEMIRKNYPRRPAMMDELRKAGF